MAENKKFYFSCDKCGEKIDSFHSWFKAGQLCPSCKSDEVYVVYKNGLKGLDKVLEEKGTGTSSLWRYFDYLPVLEKENIVSLSEGDVTIHRWKYLENFAKDSKNLNIKVYAHRQDRNYATATFKDLAGSVVSSVLKENNINRYVVASTGNIGVAFSRYLHEAGIHLHAFIPNNSPKAQEAEIACFGQQVFRVNGDYGKAKEMAAAFAKKFNILLTGTSLDPMRIEAKKTMAYEWLRNLPEYPTVYMQALSGGTGPLGVSKAVRELKDGGYINQGPRLILVQSDKCPPMADAWDRAKENGFPDGFENSFDVVNDPETEIPTLATGNPKAYPVIARKVRESNGEIIRFCEGLTSEIAIVAADEAGARIGPAASITVGGFFRAVMSNHIKDGDVVVINIGEGIRRSPQFLETFIQDPVPVNSVEECKIYDDEAYRKSTWKRLMDALELGDCGSNQRPKQ